MKDNSKMILKYTVALTTIIEMITIFFRFGLGLQSTRDTASTIGKLTFGIRIHHGFVGIFILFLFIWFRFESKNYQNYIRIFALSLIFSDIIHHYLLYVITGNANLDIFYPES